MRASSADGLGPVADLPDAPLGLGQREVERATRRSLEAMRDLRDRDTRRMTDHLGSCFRGQAGAPTRLRVRLTVPQKGGATQHVATDYRAPIADASRACVARELAKTSFPAPTFGKWVILVHAFDAR